MSGANSLVGDSSSKSVDLAEDELDMFAASLGGSLMKDLLADLAVDEEDAAEWLSLEQLEQDLKYMELENSNPTLSDNSNSAMMDAFGSGRLVTSQPPTSAAGMVVNRQAAVRNAPTATAMPPAMDAMDVWSLSLQQFTASALEADFLQADTARKNQQQQHPPPPWSNVATTTTTTTTSATVAPPPGLMTADFASYDVTESVTVTVSRPPPGMSSTPTPDVVSQRLISQAADKLVQELQHIREEEEDEDVEQFDKPFSTQADQLVRDLAQGLHRISETTKDLEGGDDSESNTPPIKVPKPAPMTPQNSMSFSMSSSERSAPTPQPTPVTMKPMNSKYSDAMLSAGGGGDDTIMIPPVAMPIQASSAWNHPQQFQQPLWPPPDVTRMMVLPHHQQQQPPPPPPRHPIFANPHPAASPVPTKALASRYMTARDISYVVHSMLKPILAAESAGTMSTYHLQYWMRHHPVKPPPPAPKNKSGEESKDDANLRELVSRHQRAKEWSSEHKVLGQSNKTNVARPRALIAVSAAESGTTTDDGSGSASQRQQRAALWKARIYCDQAYQCFTAVVDSWKLAPGAPSASVQPYLLKLMKCFGVSVQTVLVANDDGGDGSAAPNSNTTARNQYAVDITVLQLLLKLAKGKILLARVLEQALLPPAVVQVLLPVALQVLTATPVMTNEEDAMAAAAIRADDRVFAAWTVVIQTLPDLSLKTLRQAVQVIQPQSDAALSSTLRMQCTHALLQRGGVVAASSTTDPTLTQEWLATETEFMNSLTGL